MAQTETRPWDIVDSLDSEERIAAYLDAALEDGDPQLVVAALGDIARAKGMTEVARNAGLGRQSLYKALSPDGNPEFATVLKVIKSLGLRLTVSP
ncbi:addiction module antidote protein [Azospirillum largimobile]